MHATIASGLLLTVGAMLATAQSTANLPRAVLSGYVAEAVSGSIPHILSDVEIGDLESGVRTHSDRYGAFRLEGLTPGAHVVVLRKVGYAPLTVQVDLLADEATEVDFHLVRATELDTIRVLAVAAEGPEAFRRRAEKGMGRYFTREQIAKTSSRSVGDLLRLSGGVRIDPVTGEAHAPRTEYYNSDGPRCTRMVMMVDGVVRADGFDPRQLSTEHVAGVEIYTSAATLPFELRNFASAMCGLIAVWTR